MNTRVAALVFLLAACPQLALAQAFNQFVGFGDSTVDSGWYRNLSFKTGNAVFDAALPNAVANGGGFSTTGPGPISSELLAAHFGLNGDPANQGGANYATGGARNNQTGALPNAVSTATQINNYLAANNGSANSDALYLIGSGGNDVSLYVGQVNAVTITLVQALDSVVRSAGDLVSAIRRLSGAGARYFVVRNQPQSFGTSTEKQLRAAYNSALWSGLAASGVNFIPSDFDGLLRAVTSNLSSFGFIAGAGPACVAPPGAGSGYAILCSPKTLVSPDAAQTHLFADDLHLSSAGQKIVADYEYSLIVAPSMISMLAEAPVATRSTLVRSIRNQIPVSQHSRGKSGFNVWLAGDVSSLRIGNAPGFPDDPGTPVSLTAGFDYKLAGDNLIGVALTVGRQQADFSAGFGNFTQKEFAASVYFAGVRGPVWFDTIATYGWLDNRIARTVPVGITVQDNSGSAAGSNVSLAGDIGYDFRFGAFTHGPLAGITLQQVRIDGFTETGSFTSLAFGSQTRNSAVGHLGYQVSYQTGAWRPFARAAWDHELASTDRSVTASLTTIAAPSYSMPAVTTGRDWADVTAGATVAIADNLTGLIAVNSIMSRRNVAAYGGELGLNIAF